MTNVCNRQFSVPSFGRFWSLNLVAGLYRCVGGAGRILSTVVQDGQYPAGSRQDKGVMLLLRMTGVSTAERKAIM